MKTWLTHEESIQSILLIQYAKSSKRNNSDESERNLGPAQNRTIALLYSTVLQRKMTELKLVETLFKLQIFY